jgi:hypothetical protein
VLYGLYCYQRHREVSGGAWQSLLALHCRTNGKFSDMLARLLRRMRPPRAAAPVSGLLGKLSVERQREIAAQISRDGFFIFDETLPPAICDEVGKFAGETPAVIEGRGRTAAERVKFDSAMPISKTYRLVSEDIIANPAMQRIMADSSMLAIAERYLGALPTIAGVDVWWSPVYGNVPGQDAAQLFHFDFDPAPIWLHFFIYLTDVGPGNGPHVYVRGSHRAGNPAMAPLLRRGYVRISDQEIGDAFGTDNIVELCGRRGTVIAVDTRGFHKGKMPTAGYRLVAQMIFACPQYNMHAPRERICAGIEPSLAAAMKATPRVYERYV